MGCIEKVTTGLPKKKTPTQLFFSSGKTIFSMATILPVNIGDMCVSKAAKYLSQAHFCSWESGVRSWALIFRDDKLSSIYAHCVFQGLDGCAEKRGNNHNQILVQPILERRNIELTILYVISRIDRKLLNLMTYH